MTHPKRERLPSRKVFTAVAGAIAEWLFAIVPLIVLSIVLSHLQHGGDVLESAEWSFGASVLAGQGVVRFVSGLVKGQDLSVDRVLLGVSAALVFVVVPANIVLALVLMNKEEDPTKHLSSLMVTGQVSLFVVASLLFIVAASFGHLWARRSED
jgi:hypothetical protein